MAKETEQEIGAPAKPCESAVRLLAYHRLSLGGGIAHPLLDVPMALLLRVQFRGVSRQPLQLDFLMLGQEGLDHVYPAFRGPIFLTALSQKTHR